MCVLQRLVAATGIDYVERLGRLRLAHPANMREKYMPNMTSCLQNLTLDPRVTCLSALNSVFAKLWLELPLNWWQRQQCRGVAEALDTVTGEIEGPPVGCRIEEFTEEFKGKVLKLLPGQKALILQDDGTEMECNVSFYNECSRPLQFVLSPSPHLFFPFFLFSLFFFLPRTQHRNIERNFVFIITLHAYTRRYREVQFNANLSYAVLGKKVYCIGDMHKSSSASQVLTSSLFFMFCLVLL